MSGLLKMTTLGFLVTGLILSCTPTVYWDFLLPIRLEVEVNLQNGTPVPDAKIYLFPEPGAPCPQSTMIFLGETDKDGFFSSQYVHSCGGKYKKSDRSSTVESPRFSVIVENERQRDRFEAELERLQRKEGYYHFKLEVVQSEHTNSNPVL